MLWCFGALVLWCFGALVLWCFGALVLWCFGALVLWCFGALVLWCFGALVLWCFGALVLWCFGALVLWWLVVSHFYQRHEQKPNYHQLPIQPSLGHLPPSLHLNRLSRSLAARRSCARAPAPESRPWNLTASKAGCCSWRVLSWLLYPFELLVLPFFGRLPRFVFFALAGCRSSAPVPPVHGKRSLDR